MNLPQAALTAIIFSFAVHLTIAKWYLSPALKQRPLKDAIMLLLWFHVGRYVALQLYSANQIGHLDIGTAGLNIIVFGDVVVAIAAFITLWSLHLELSVGRWLIWLVPVLGVVDAFLASTTAVAENFIASMSNLAWFILVFYVPLLIITELMLIWQLYSRRNEPLYSNSIEN